MKQTSAELKRQARESLSGHWGLVIGANVLAMLILYGAILIFYVPMFLTILAGSLVGLGVCIVGMLLVSLAAGVLMAGVVGIQMNLARRREIKLSMMFSQFANRPHRYILGTLLLAAIGLGCLTPGYICVIAGDVLGQGFLMGIGIVLWLGGLIVYMILTFRYALITYLFLDDSRIGVIAAYRESKQLMAGNKGRLLYIFLSFIGWSILGTLSCGIGMLWVMPYMTQTSVEFYLDVKGEADNSQSVQSEAVTDWTAEEVDNSQNIEE